MPDVLNSYLVSLGFTVDQPTLHKFQDALASAEHLATSTTSGVAREVLKWQGAIVGAFTAISAGVIGTVDAVARADQEYRLFGLQMMVTQDNARKLKLTLDALGEPLEVIALDPELHARFMQLYAPGGDLDQFSKILSSSFKTNMRRVRDLRFELTRLQLALKFVFMQVKSDVFKKFGIDIDHLDQTFQHWISYLIQNGQYLSDILTNELVPALREFFSWARKTASILSDLALTFTNTIAALSGDKGLSDSTLKFEKLAHALHEVAHWLTVILTLETLPFRIGGTVAKTLSELATGSVRKDMGLGAGEQSLVDLTQAFRQILGDSEKALKPIPDFSQSPAPTTPKPTSVTPRPPVKPVVSASPVGTQDMAVKPVVSASPVGTQDMAVKAAALAQKVGQKVHIDPKLIFEQWAFETGGFTNLGSKNLNNLAGIRVPGTTVYEKFGNLEEFAERYAEVIQSKRYTGLKEARTEKEFAAVLKKGGYYEGPEKNYGPGMASHGQEYRDASTHIGQLTVIVPGGTQATAPDIAKAITDELDRRNQLVLGQLASGSY